MAGSQRREGDPGPGPGVFSVDATRTGEALLGNPFPMGDGGEDERRRALVLDLHRRWLEAAKTAAADMRLPSGSPMPLDVRPPPHLAELTGAEVMRRLARAVEEARRARCDVLRFGCAPKCRSGFPCHCESLASATRERLARGEAPTGGAFQLAPVPPPPEPAQLAGKVARRLETFSLPVWQLVGARHRLLQRREERQAAADGLTVNEQRRERRQRMRRRRW